MLGLTVLAGCGRLATSLDLSPSPLLPAPAAAPIAVTKGHLNVRSGPGMSHRIVAVLPPKTSVEILGEQGIWRRVAVERRGKIRDGWLSSKYLTITEARPEPTPTPPPEPVEPEPPSRRQEPAGAVPLALEDPRPAEETLAVHPTRTAEPERIAALEPTPTPDLPEPTAAPTSEPEPEVRAGESVIASGPYAAEIRPLRDAFAEARFADLEAGLAILASEMGMLAPGTTAAPTDPRIEALRMLERAAVDGDRGRLDRAVARLQEGKDRVSSVASAPTDGDGVVRAADGGSEAPVVDRLLPFERVWLANYDAFFRLLRGDELSVNLARAAVERQLAEEKALEERLVATEAELLRARARIGERRADEIQELLERDYAASAVRGESATSALATPFPYYVAGVVQEILAGHDPSLREEALAAYARALQMSPADDLFRRAVDDLTATDPAGDDRVVHVLVAEGFVPERKMLSRDLTVGDRELVVRLPIHAPVPSPVSGARLRVKGAKTETPFSAIADLEASAFRLERDLTVERAAAVLRALPAPSEAAAVDSDGGWFGLFGGSRPPPAPSVAVEQMPTPETSGWMMLPARIYAARLRLSKGPHTIQIEILGADGKPIDSAEVLLDPAAPSFVYLRTAGRILTTRSRDPEWFSSAAMASSADAVAPR